ncbi:MAG: D-lyxose/D-mannose family sugar isomerase [Chthoniobacteraceae bacterium]
MKLTRSTINRSIRDALHVASHFGFALPPFATWAPYQWNEAGAEHDEIRDCMLGWDVTDFGSGNFEETGRVLFTLRNGLSNDPRYPKPYAEKLLIDPESQRAPAHFHRSKREDIICRHGGNILIQLTKATPTGDWSEERFPIQVNGGTRKLAPRGIVRLTPGESLTIPPGTIHQFWAEEGTGWELEGLRYSLSSEISSVCDDWNDNVFFAPWAVRFPEILEDEQPTHHLCHEYPCAAV